MHHKAPKKIIVIVFFCMCYAIHYRRSYSHFMKQSEAKSQILELVRSISRQYPIVHHNISAVLGADHNSIYLFPLPITVLFWKRLGVSSIICFANSEDSYSDAASQFIIMLLKVLQARFIFLSTSKAPSHTIAQTCRIYVASAAKLTIEDTDILITSDSDLWIFTLDNHVPQWPQNIFLYNAECCGMTSKPGRNESFPMRPMATIAMSAMLWRDLLGVEKKWLSSGDVLAERLFVEFSEELIANGRGKPYVSESWYADQIIISEKLAIFENKSEFREEWVGKSVMPPFRIDRAFWPDKDTIQEYANMTTDSHILHPLYDVRNWYLTYPLLQVMLNDDIARCLTRFRNLYVQLLEDNSRRKLF